jgi:hypothetical protein
MRDELDPGTDKGFKIWVGLVIGGFAIFVVIFFSCALFDWPFVMETRVEQDQRQDREIDQLESIIRQMETAP